MGEPSLFLGEIIGRGAHSTVYAGRVRDRDVAVKVALNASQGASLRLRREAAAIARIAHEGVVGAWSVGRFDDGRSYMVSERVDGVPLSEMLRRGARPEAWLLELGCALALTLHYVHERGLVHRDLKPDNVLMPRDGAPRPRLIDFGLAVTPGKDVRAGGTVAYSAPEQTGALHRAVDGRADLYALGVILFEAAAGHLPFMAEDTVTLIRQHAQLAPPDLADLRPDLTPALHAIVARLLAKDPDDRYPTAADVYRELASLASLAPRNLEQEVKRLHGRDQEQMLLEPMFARAMAREGRSVVISGAQGSGRSELAQALLRLARRADKIALHAVPRTSANLPFGVWLDMLRQLVEARGGLAEANLCQSLKIAAVGGEPFVAAVFPEFAALLSVASAPTEAGQDRYYESVGRFIVALLELLGGGVLVVEELQSIDNESFEVLTRVARDCPQHSLLLVCTQDADEARRRSLASHERIALEPLGADAMRGVIQGELGVLPAPPELLHEIQACSLGMPLGALEALRAMLDAGLLTPDWAGWRLDHNGLAELALPKGLLELMLQRWSALDDATRDVLDHAALCGSEFALETVLTILPGAPEADDVQLALDAAAGTGLLSVNGARRYRFAHRGLSEALSDRVRDEERRRVHALLARLEDERSGDEDAQLYGRAYHHQLGLAPETARAAVEATRKAGERALLRRAPERAFALLSWSERTAQEHAVPVDYALYAKLAEARREAGDPAGALAWLERACALCNEPVERAALHVQAAELSAFSLTNTRAVIHQVGEVYRLLEARRPGNGLFTLLAAIWWTVVVLVLEMAWFGSRRGRLDRRRTLLARVCEASGVQSILDNEVVHTFYLCVRPAYLTLTLGPCSELVDSLATRSVAAAVLGLPRRVREYYLNRALHLGHTLRAHESIARAEVRGGVACAFSGELTLACDRLESVLKHHACYLGLNDLMLATAELAHALVQRGYTDRARALLEERARELTCSREGDPRWDNLRPQLMVCQAVLGHRGEAEQALAGFHAEATDPSHGFAWIGRWGVLVRMHIELHDFKSPALDAAIENLLRTSLALSYLPWHIVSAFVDVAWARCHQLHHSPKEQRPQRLERLRAAVGTLKRTQAHPTMTIHRSLLEAALLSADGQHGIAIERLDLVEVSAQEQDILNGVYLARLLRARAFLAVADKAAAHQDAQLALRLAIDMGWTARARYVGREFGLSAPSSNASTRTMTRTFHTLPRPGSTEGTLEPSARGRDGVSVLLQLSLALAKSNEPRAQGSAALDALLSILTAERGALFVVDEQDGSLQRIAARDHRGQDLADDAPYARSLVQRAIQTGNPLVVAGTEEGQALGSASIVAHDLRSVVCAPLTLRDEVLGAIYLDSQLAKGIFTGEELDELVAISRLIAVACWSARRAQRELSRRALEKDLQLRNEVRRLLLPKGREGARGSLEWAAHQAVAAHTEGDFWVEHPLPNGGVRLLVGHVSGQEAGRAMVIATIVGCMHALCELQERDPEALLGLLEEIAREVCRDEFSLSLSMLDVEASLKVHYWTSSSPLLRLAHRKVLLHGGEPRLSPAGAARFESGCLDLGEHDLLLLSARDVIGRADRAGEVSQVERLETCSGLSPSTARERFLASGGGSEPRQADLTFIFVGRRPDDASLHREPSHRVLEASP